MKTTNPVFQVLVTSGNQDVLDANLRITDLKVGQVGVFDYHTGLSLSEASVVGDTRDIYLAVGIDKAGAAAAQPATDINKSGGQMVQVRHLKTYMLKPYVDSVAKVVHITGFKAKCDSDYALKVEFRNQKIYRLNGYNQFAKTYTFHTGCCADDCVSCGDGDCNELATGLVANINADLDALVVADAFANTISATINTAPTSDANTSVTVGTTVYVVPVLDADTVVIAATKIVAAINTQTDSPYYASNVAGSSAVITIHAKATATGDTATFAVSGAGVTANAIALSTTSVTDLVAFKAAYPGVCLGIRLTATIQAIATYCSVDPEYFNPRGTDIIVTTPEGFTCNGTVTVITDLQYPEGKGYDLQHAEYEAGGWNGKPGPYRISELTGLTRKGFEYYASAAVNYNVLNFLYDIESTGGAENYLSDVETIVAVPCGDGTTLPALTLVLDAIFTQFRAQNPAAAAADCTNTNVSTINSPILDGIESLS